jgi:hypothetical protein
MMIAGAVILAALIGGYAFLRFMDGPRGMREGHDWEDYNR